MAGPVADGKPVSQGFAVRFILPNGTHFTQFSMVGVPRQGDTVLRGDKDYKAAQVAWDIEPGIHGATPVVVLEEA